MRLEDLREHTRKAAAAKGSNKMKTRLISGEKLGRKRMAMIGAVYDADPAPRTIDGVIAPDDQPDRRRNPGPKAFNKWLVGSVTDNTQTVISAVFDQAEQRDSTHRRTWVVLVDGAKAQIEQILTEAEVRGVQVHIVVASGTCNLMLSSASPGIRLTNCWRSGGRGAFRSGQSTTRIRIKIRGGASLPGKQESGRY